MTRTDWVESPPGGTVVAVALKVASDDPAATFTDAGTPSVELLVETGTLTPPDGAGAERVTVQMEDAPASRVVALQVNAEMSKASVRLKVMLWEVPPNVAVTVAN